MRRSRSHRLFLLQMCAWSVWTMACFENGPQIIEAREERPGERCIRGGVQVLSGTDGDQDGQLDAKEVVGSIVVCDLAPYIPPSEPPSLGDGVDIEGDTLVLSGPDAGGSQGAVYVFSRKLGNWIPEQVIFGERCGRGCVDLDGDTLAIGPRIYRQQGENWIFEASLGSASRAHVTLHKGQAFVTSAYGVPSSTVQVFEERDGQWEFQTEILPPRGSYFGDSTDVRGDHLIVSGFYVGVPESPIAYLYRRNGEEWTLRASLGHHASVRPIRVALDVDRAVVMGENFKSYALSGEEQTMPEELREGGSVTGFAMSNSRLLVVGSVLGEYQSKRSDERYHCALNSTSTRHECRYAWLLGPSPNGWELEQALAQPVTQNIALSNQELIVGEGNKVTLRPF